MLMRLKQFQSFISVLFHHVRQALCLFYLFLFILFLPLGYFIFQLFIVVVVYPCLFILLLFIVN